MPCGRCGRRSRSGRPHRARGLLALSARRQDRGDHRRSPRPRWRHAPHRRRDEYRRPPPGGSRTGDRAHRHRRDSAAEEILQYLRGTAGASAPIQGLSIVAVIAGRRGDHDEAVRLSREAEAAAATNDLLIDRADVALDGAEVLLLAGRSAESRAAAEVAIERFERKEYGIGLRRAREFLAALPG